MNNKGDIAESKFQKHIIDRIKKTYEKPGMHNHLEILKNDANYKQGIPDLSIFYENKYCELEVKKNKDASHRPNQDYYINKYNNMSMAFFICPENEDLVMQQMLEYFTTD